MTRTFFLPRRYLSSTVNEKKISTRIKPNITTFNKIDNQVVIY